MVPASNSVVQCCPPGAISAIDELPDDFGHLCAIARPRSINQWRGCVHNLQSQRIAHWGCASTLAPNEQFYCFRSCHAVSASEGLGHQLTFVLVVVGDPRAACCVTAAFASANSRSVSAPSVCSCFSSRSSPARLMPARHSEADALTRPDGPAVYTISQAAARDNRGERRVPIPWIGGPHARCC